VKFRWLVDGDLTLGLLLPHHTEASFVRVDQNRDHLRPWLLWVDRTLRVEDSLAFNSSPTTRAFTWASGGP